MNNEENEKQLREMLEKTKQANQKKNYSFKVSEVIVMVFFTCILSFFIGSSITELKMNNKETKNEQKIEDKYLNEFVNNYEYILNNYYKEIKQSDLIDGAIRGMMDVLDDPYSIYMIDEEYNNLNISLNGSYKGLGVEITNTDEGYLLVVGVFKNSPAHDAGIKPGDIILKINEIDTNTLSSSEFSNMVLNGNEQEYILKIRRQEENLDVKVVKNDISLQSVSSKIIEEDGIKIGYIYISIFAINTFSQFKANLEELENSGINALIIDVRSNTGGHLSSAEAISSLFVDDSHIIYQLSQNDNITKVKSVGKVNKEYKIVLLADSYSASASELLIGCLKDNLNATLIGTKTYGKGTVQELITLSSGDQYKITTKKWLTPNGEWINEKGFEPDIEVKLNDEYFYDPTDENDNQLREAINYIKGNI